MEEKGRKHIILLPFMAKGHLKPFMELAHQIQKRSNDLTITLLSTPINARLLRDISSPNCFDSTSIIRVVDLPFVSSDHNLPDDTENTNLLPLTSIIALFHASTSLESPLRHFISNLILSNEGRPPLCLITDVFLGWAVSLANSFGSPAFTYTTGSAYGTAAYISVWSSLPHQDLEEFSIPGLPESHRYNRSQLHRFVRSANGKDEWSTFFQPQIKMAMSSQGWLCNTIEEMEVLGMSSLRSYLKLPVWAVGSVSDPVSSLGGDEDVRIWLDNKPHDTVLYVSFGSQNTITASQMMALAEGLEESGRSFVWVIRPPIGFDIQGDYRSEWLPDGFQQRVGGRGLLLHKWAPQTYILAHKSTGAFLSHCGWNSVMESLSNGVPMIGWPLAAEQVYNSKMLEEDTGVAVELTNGLEGKLSKERVVEVVKMVLDRQGRGLDMKRKAVEVCEKIRLAVTEEGGRKGSALASMDHFLNTLLSPYVHEPNQEFADC